MSATCRKEAQRLSVGRAFLPKIVLAIVALATYTTSITPAYAVYNSNMTGVVTLVATYTEGDYIYFQLSNQPTSHPGCSPAWFVIPEDITPSRRNHALAQLLAARYSQEPLNIGFDATGDCAHGYIRVHRVG